MASNKSAFLIDFCINSLLLLSIPLIIAIGPILGIQTIVTLVFIPILFLLSFYIHNYKVYFYKPVSFYLIFIFIAALSVINANDMDLYLSDMKTILGTVLLGLALFNFVIKKGRYLFYILYSYILATYILGLYLYKNGMLQVAQISNASYRITDEIFNANMFSYYIFLAVFSFFILFYLSNAWWIKLLYFVSIFFYAIMIFLSGSRGGVAIFLIINVFYWTYIGLINSPKLVKATIIFLLILLMSMPILSYLYFSVFENTNIGYRFNALFYEGEDTSRIIILKIAFGIFLDHPLLGVGAGNFVALNPYHLFSHNNFMEILVNHGIIAFIVYMVVFYSFFRITFFYFRNSVTIRMKKLLAVILLFTFSFMGYSFLYPFFKVIPFTGFIFILFALVYRFKYSLLTNRRCNHIKGNHLQHLKVCDN